MESVDAREEKALLLPGIWLRSYDRDVHILSFAFFVHFFSLWSSAEPGARVSGLFNGEGTGLKNSLVLVSTGNSWLFIASHLKPSWYTMVLDSVYLGFAAFIIWVGQSHASDGNLHEGAVIGSFDGEFWGMFASTQVIGNFVSLASLRGGKGGSFSGKTLLCTVFLASVTVGNLLLFALHKRDAKTNDLPSSSTNFCAIFGSLLKLVISPRCDKRMLLIAPLLAYSVLQKAFLWDDFNKYIVEPAFWCPWNW